MKKLYILLVVAITITLLNLSVVKADVVAVAHSQFVIVSATADSAVGGTNEVMIKVEYSYSYSEPKPSWSFSIGRSWVQLIQFVGRDKVAVAAGDEACSKIYFFDPFDSSSVKIVELMDVSCFYSFYQFKEQRIFSDYGDGILFAVAKKSSAYHIFVKRIDKTDLSVVDVSHIKVNNRSKIYFGWWESSYDYNPVIFVTRDSGITSAESGKTLVFEINQTSGSRMVDSFKLPVSAEIVYGAYYDDYNSAGRVLRIITPRISAWTPPTE